MKTYFFLLRVRVRLGFLYRDILGLHSLHTLNAAPHREEQRSNEALTLLLKSNLSCKEIAALCHYGSYSSFFRSFKKRYNVSPEIFRKRNL